MGSLAWLPLLRLGKMLVKARGMTYGWRREEGWGLPSKRDGLQGHKCLSEVPETWEIQSEEDTRQGYRSCSEKRGPDKTLRVTVATGRDNNVTDWRQDKRHVVVVVVLLRFVLLCSESRYKGWWTVLHARVLAFLCHSICLVTLEFPLVLPCTWYWS